MSTSPATPKAAERSSQRTTFTTTTKKQVQKLTPESNRHKCFACPTINIEFSHIIAQTTKDPWLTEVTNRGLLPEDFKVRDCDNCILLCSNCHKAFDANPPDLIILPKYLSWFIEEELKDYKERWRLWKAKGTERRRKVPSAQEYYDYCQSMEYYRRRTRSVGLVEYPYGLFDAFYQRNYEGRDEGRKNEGQGLPPSGWTSVQWHGLPAALILKARLWLPDRGLSIVVPQGIFSTLEHLLALWRREPWLTSLSLAPTLSSSMGSMSSPLCGCQWREVEVEQLDDDTESEDTEEISDTNYQSDDAEYSDDVDYSDDVEYSDEACASEESSEQEESEGADTGSDVACDSSDSDYSDEPESLDAFEDLLRGVSRMCIGGTSGSKRFSSLRSESPSPSVRNNKTQAIKSMNTHTKAKQQRGTSSGRKSDPAEKSASNKEKNGRQKKC